MLFDIATSGSAVEEAIAKNAHELDFAAVRLLERRIQTARQCACRFCSCQAQATIPKRAFLCAWWSGVAKLSVPFDILLCCISSKIFTGCTLPVHAWHTKNTWVLGYSGIKAPGMAASLAAVCLQLLLVSICSLLADCTPFLPTWCAVAIGHCTVRKRQINLLDAVPQRILAKLYYI